MRGMTLIRSVWGLLAASLTSVVVLAGCSIPECESNRDCGAEEFCNSDRQCTPLGPPGDGIGEGEGEGEIPSEGEGEGEPNVDEFVDTNVPITMFNRLDATTAIVGVGDPAFAIDELREFDLTTGELGDTVRNFQQGDPQCLVDTIQFFDETDPDTDFLELPDETETWYSCTNGSLIIEYGNDFAQRYLVPNVSSAEIVFLLEVVDGTANNADARLLVAERGGNALTEVRFGLGNNTPDPIRTARTTVPVLPGEFTSIISITPLLLDDPQLGDVLFVLDRSDPPRFVPIQRIPGEDTWRAPPDLTNGTNLDVMELPEGTHFAFFRQEIGIPDPFTLNIETADIDIANIVAVIPELNGGTVSFLRYEREVQNPGSSNFRDLVLDASDAADIEIPDPSDRVLFEELRIGNDTFFAYALTNSDHVWRFPLHRNQNDNRFNEVRRVVFDQQDDVVLGMIPFPGNPDFVWVGLDNRNVIQLLEFENVR